MFLYLKEVFCRPHGFRLRTSSIRTITCFISSIWTQVGCREKKSIPIFSKFAKSVIHPSFTGHHQGRSLPPVTSQSPALRFPTPPMISSPAPSYSSAPTSSQPTQNQPINYQPVQNPVQTNYPKQKDVIRTHDDVIRTQLARQRELSDVKTDSSLTSTDILTRFWEQGIRDKV